MELLSCFLKTLFLGLRLAFRIRFVWPWCLLVVYGNSMPVYLQRFVCVFGFALHPLWVNSLHISGPLEKQTQPIIWPSLGEWKLLSVWSVYLCPCTHWTNTATFNQNLVKNRQWRTSRVFRSLTNKQFPACKTHQLFCLSLFSLSHSYFPLRFCCSSTTSSCSWSLFSVFSSFLTPTLTDGLQPLFHTANMANFSGFWQQLQCAQICEYSWKKFATSSAWCWELSQCSSNKHTVCIGELGLSGIEWNHCRVKSTHSEKDA